MPPARLWTAAPRPVETLGTAPGHSERSALTPCGRLLTYAAPVSQDTPAPLRPVDVQRLLRCGRTTVHDLAARGALRVVRTTPGGHRRYAPDSPALLAAYAGGEVSSGE